MNWPVLVRIARVRMPISRCCQSTCSYQGIYRPSWCVRLNLPLRGPSVLRRSQLPFGWRQQLQQARLHHMRQAATMQGPTALAGVSALMFVGSYLAGLLPMLRAGNTQTLQLVNAAGAGLLVGATMCVVLPEGFVTFVEAQMDADDKYPEWLLGFAVLLGFLVMLSLQLLADHWGNADAAGDRDLAASANSSSVCTTAPAATRGHSHAHLNQLEGSDPEHTALLGSDIHSEGAASCGGIIPVAALEVAGKPSRAGDVLTAADQVLYGLVVHAAADGVAVGAACLSSSLALTSSVAVAILIHKFPVAFGLSAYLRGAGWFGSRLQKGLILFCAAAPVAAVLTYLVAGSVASMSDGRNVALCLLFSGGTVLHAGLVHVLPSVLGTGHDHGQEHHHSDGGSSRRPSAHGRHASPRPRAAVLAMLVATTFVPLIVNALVPEAE